MNPLLIGVGTGSVWPCLPPRNNYAWMPLCAPKLRRMNMLFSRKINDSRCEHDQW